MASTSNRNSELTYKIIPEKLLQQLAVIEQLDASVKDLQDLKDLKEGVLDKIITRQEVFDQLDSIRDSEDQIHNQVFGLISGLSDSLETKASNDYVDSTFARQDNTYTKSETYSRDETDSSLNNLESRITSSYQDEIAEMRSLLEVADGSIGLRIDSVIENLENHNNRITALQDWADSNPWNDDLDTIETRLNEDIDNLRTSTSNAIDGLAGSVNGLSDEVDSIRDEMQGSKFGVIVIDGTEDDLPDPSEADETKLYVVRFSDEAGFNRFTEYVVVDGEWEKLGSQVVDLSVFQEKAAELTTQIEQLEERLQGDIESLRSFDEQQEEENELNNWNIVTA